MKDKVTEVKNKVGENNKKDATKVKSKAAENQMKNTFDEKNVIPLSYDHKPNNKFETERIIKIQHQVDEEANRVDGSLAVSRAFGDFMFKDRFDLGGWDEQAVTAMPDVLGFELTKDHHFFVLACDGIWDCMTNVEMMEYLNNKIDVKKKKSGIISDLMEKIIAKDLDLNGDGLGTDNMTCMIVEFKH